MSDSHFTSQIYHLNFENRTLRSGPVECYLDHSGEDVGERYEHEVVERCRVWDLGQVLPGLQAKEGHCEHCCYP